MIKNSVNNGTRTLVKAIEFQQVTLTCTSSGGYPKPDLIWFSASETLTPTTETSSNNPEGVFIVTTNYRFYAERKYDRKTYSCKSTQGQLSESQVTSVILYLDCK